MGTATSFVSTIITGIVARRVFAATTAITAAVANMLNKPPLLDLVAVVIALSFQLLVA